VDFVEKNINISNPTNLAIADVVLINYNIWQFAEVLIVEIKSIVRAMEFSTKLVNTEMRKLNITEITLPQFIINRLFPIAVLNSDLKYADIRGLVKTILVQRFNISQDVAMAIINESAVQLGKSKAFTFHSEYEIHLFKNLMNRKIISIVFLAEAAMGAFCTFSYLNQEISLGVYSSICYALATITAGLVSDLERISAIKCK